jgi:iron complex transport system ATP-binding protein
LVKEGALARLEIQEVEFYYTKEPVLKGICMGIGNSEMLSIIGPNGAGKSTILKCMDKILSPQKGTVLLDNQNIKSMNRMDIAKKLGYIPQKVTQIFPATVFDMVLLGRRPHVSWRSSDKDIDIVLGIMEMLNIEDLAMRDFNGLSGGQQQNVFFAKALAQEPEILLLDEPTSNLDIKHQLEVMNIIRNVVKEKKISAVLSIHDLNLAARYSDRLVMMKNGEIYAFGEPLTILTAENIRAVYDVEVKVIKESNIPYIVPLAPIDNKKGRLTFSTGL